MSQTYTGDFNKLLKDTNRNNEAQDTLQQSYIEAGGQFLSTELMEKPE